MKDPITPFGRRWEILRSLWLIWLFGPFALTAFISFLYIGIRAGRNKWTIAGIIYLFGALTVLYILGGIEEDGIIVDFLAGLSLSIWLFAMIHGFLARKEYLRIIAKNVIDHPFKQTPPIIVKTNFPFFSDSGKRGDLNAIKKRKNPLPIADQKEPFMLHINEASLKKIASHPYIGNIVARQIVDVRNKVGSFQSYSHFTETTKMKPHILAKAKPYLIFNEEDEANLNKKGRDQKQQRANSSQNKQKYRSGRIVDI